MAAFLVYPTTHKQVLIPFILLWVVSTVFFFYIELDALAQELMIRDGELRNIPQAIDLALDTHHFTQLIDHRHFALLINIIVGTIAVFYVELAQIQDDPGASVLNTTHRALPPLQRIAPVIEGFS